MTPFEYVAPTEQSVEIIKYFRNKFNDLYNLIKLLPE
jgi:hypothetical protein